ncbi:DUF2381 family protein [Archangium violaceum]|uniref:DUF2381 family protein n=1 Tax=Archangium violaceum TaxID=83451 RepID=UPI002B28BCCF|nr:DUF2381 family protein [Archangium violaceum]
MLALLLTGSTTAAQQPQLPAREQQQRQVVVPSGPNDPVPEVRVAAKVTTYLRFNAPIDKASLEVEGRATRFKLVDPGEYGRGADDSHRHRAADGTPPRQSTGTALPQ